jgi:hypothetical protein
MEEFFYDYITSNIEKLKDIDYVYIPVFWTNLQVSDGFEEKKQFYNNLLNQEYSKFNSDTTFFTIVQHDDCVLLNLPKNTLIFGACSGHIPLPLIYEDTNHTLITIYNSITDQPFERNFLCSFIGSETCTLRGTLKHISSSPGFVIQTKGWDVNVNINDINNFVGITIRSLFCLAPRGYGRNSFRYYEALYLGSIPIYIYDDHNWLPYREVINYDDFSITIHENDIINLPNIINNLDINKIHSMQNNIKNIGNLFSLDYMCEYIINTLKNNNTLKTINDTFTLIPGKQIMSILP